MKTQRELKLGLNGGPTFLLVSGAGNNEGRKLYILTSRGEVLCIYFCVSTCCHRFG